MSRHKPQELHTQISTLKSELELSTFLNKGVLQTNSEYKLRIVELERENTVLRVAESRLSRTEDRLDAAEKRVEKEEGERRRVEEESESWKRRWERLNRKLEGIRAMVVMEESEGELGPSAPRSRPSVRRAIAKGSSASRRIEQNPSQSLSPVRQASSTKKRRRVQDSPKPAKEPEKIDTPSLSPAPRQPKPQPQRVHVPQATSAKARTGPRTSGTAKKRESRHYNEEGFEVKVENESPRRVDPINVYDDEDPLAML